MKTNVSLEPPTGGEILVGAGTHPFTARFIEMLRTP